MRTVIVLAAIVASLGSMAHGAPLGLVTHTGARADAVVSIRTFQFAPDTLRVTAGTRVVWTNADEIEHTITSGTSDAREHGLDGVVPKRGATYSAVFERPGTYRYFCERHRFMNGTVIVKP